MRGWMQGAVGRYLLLALALGVVIVPLQPAEAGFGARRASDPQKPDVEDLLDLTVYFDYGPDSQEISSWEQ